MPHWILNDAGEPERVEDVLVWAEWFERASRDRSRIVAQDRDERGTGEVLVSTVFLGLDHSFGVGPPRLWETMILGGPLDQYCERHCTRAAALEGHARACALQRQAAR
jgi:hypothetical protein